MKLIISLAAALFTAAAAAETIEEHITHTGTVYKRELKTVATKKLRNPAIIQSARDIIPEGVNLEWDEGARSFNSYLTTEADDLDIKRIKIVNGYVADMDVIVNIRLSKGGDGVPATEHSAKCSVFLEKVTTIFESYYFLCDVDDGDQIEFER